MRIQDLGLQYRIVAKNGCMPAASGSADDDLVRPHEGDTVQVELSQL